MKKTAVTVALLVAWMFMVPMGWAQKPDDAEHAELAKALGRRLPEVAGAPTNRRLQVVDGLDPVELPFDAVQLAAKLSDRAPMAHPVSIKLGEDLPGPLESRLVLGDPSLVEEIGHLLLRHVSHPLDVQQGRLAPEGVDLLHQPLEELGGLRRLREDPGRPAKTHCPHALELPPDADAVPGRCGRQRGEEGEPAHV